MIGIYKITSPSGKVYIGQSVNIEKRWKTYKSGFSKGQIKLHNSFVKHGIDNHIFQILEACLVESLNDKERYWQDFYNCIGPEGLNLKLTNSSDKSGSFSDELKLKLSNSSKGKKMSEESKIKMRNSNLGKKLSEETKRKIGEKIKGSKHSKETKNKISQGRFGQNNPNSRLFLNTDTGIFYFTFKEAAESVSYNKVTLWRFLNGKLPNKTSIIYC